MISKALEIAKDFAKKKATEYGKRWYTENISSGPEALTPIETDLRKLAVEIYRYQASFKIAQTAVSAQRTSSTDYIKDCTKVFPTSEADGILQLRDQLRDIGDVAQDIEVRAIAYSRNEAIKAKREMERWAKSLPSVEKNGGDDRMVQRIARKMRGANNDLVRFESVSLTIDLRGDALQKLCAELIGVIMEIRRELITQNGPYALFAKECEAWRLNRIEENRY